jgi:hypothetical protein
MAKPKPSKYSRARIRSKVRRPKRAGASRGWMLTTVGLVLVGALLVVMSYNDRQNAAAVGPVVNVDHWHAYLGVNICGTWEPAVPAFEGRDGTMSKTGLIAGIHSHADFLIHDHPFGSDEAGKKATLGRYLGYAQTDLSETAIKLWPQWVPNVNFKNGQKCPGQKQPSIVQYKVGRLGKPWPKDAATGNPADHHIENGEIIAVYFLPKGAALAQPPGSQAALASITDLNGQPALSTTSSSSAPVPGNASSTSSTAPASASSSTTSSSPAGSSTSSTKP